MMTFWNAALGYESREPPTEDWVILSDPTGTGPNISLQKVDEGPTEDYRFHFDLYSSDIEGEVERLLRLGALLKEPKQPDRDFVTLLDPDGNPFDVVDVRGWSFGRRA